MKAVCITTYTGDRIATELGVELSLSWVWVTFDLSLSYRFLYFSLKQVWDERSRSPFTENKQVISHSVCRVNMSSLLVYSQQLIALYILQSLGQWRVTLVSITAVISVTLTQSNESNRSQASENKHGRLCF